MDDLSSQLPSHDVLEEPFLSFNPTRPDDRHQHPLRGLREHGPYSRSLVASVLDPIRVALIVPHGTRGVISGLLNELTSRQKARERRDYLINYPGFSAVFGVNIVPSESNAWLQLPENLDERIGRAEKPHIVLAEAIVQAVSSLQAYRSSFDVLLLYLPSRWEPCFEGDDGRFDLHDHVKAATAGIGMPTQILLKDGALSYRCRASVMWRLGIALYTKAGGIPWKLQDSESETAYIGLSYALRSREQENRFVTCCSQIFDEDGIGLEFIAYETGDAHVERDNPYLSRDEMRKVIDRSLQIYQRRHAGRRPKHLVVHKSTEFKKDEIRGCFDAWNEPDGLDLIQVQRGTTWRAINIEGGSRRSSKGKAGNYPCRRGSYVHLNGYEVLLWTQGVAPSIATNFYKEGKGIPTPLLLRRFAGHGGWGPRCVEVLGLTKMDWNNDALYNRSPVTLSYASELARIMKRSPDMGPGPYPLRFFM